MVTPYQLNDIEEPPPLLEIRIDQNENKDGVNNFEQESECKFKDNIEEVTIINEKPVDRNDTILSELNILKKAPK